MSYSEPVGHKLSIETSSVQFLPLNQTVQLHTRDMEFLLAALSEKTATLSVSKNEDERAAAVASISSLTDHLKSVAAGFKVQSQKAAQDLEAVQREQGEALTYLINLQQQLDTTTGQLESTLETVAELERGKRALSKKVEALTKENRAILKDRNDLQARIDEELGSYESLSQSWKAKEETLLDTIKTQRRATRDMRAETATLQRALSPDANGLENRRRSSNIQEDVAMRILKSQITEKETRIAQLEHQVLQLQSTTQSALSHLSESQNQIETMRTELSELEQENSMLREEAESYNLLLQNRTSSGAFMTETPLMQRSNAEGTVPEAAEPLPSSLDGFETPKEKQLRSEVRALTLYIEKILSKVKGNPELEAVLLNKTSNSNKESLGGGGNEETEKLTTPVGPTVKNRMSLLARFPVSAAAMAANAAVEMVRSVSEEK
ncbi:hypothetical protein BDR26DRAFT_860876 [Obelidium mucronatum]|nr:hypothetical protein BDR26DRAFT_860876 [Obelidium mucronatum]